MIQFFKKIILFSLLTVIVTIVINNAIQPEKYYWGNKLYEDKLNSFSEKKDSFNTVFLGSSRIAYQINPLVFDSIMRSEVSITSFNLGIEGAFCPEYYFLYEKFLESELSSDLEFVFMELSPLIARDISLLLKDRFIYYLNFNYVKFTSETILREQYPIKTKIYRFSSFWISYLYVFFGLRSNRSIFQNNSKNIEGALTFNSRGFTPLTLDKENRFNKKKFEELVIKQEKFEEKPVGMYVNEPHLGKLEELIDLSREKNINLFFIIPPIIPREEIYGLKHEIPDYIIEGPTVLADSIFYDSKNFHDPGHVNEDGAEALTFYLGEQFKLLYKSSSNN